MAEGRAESNTYPIVGAVCLVLGIVLFRHRADLLGADLGTNWLLVALGLALYSLSPWLAVVTRRHLSLSVVTGFPEISGENTTQTLLKDGVYSKVRHPRYLTMVLATLPAVYLVVVLEERELIRRFGQAFEKYRR